jgi:hypothetical protein
MAVHMWALSTTAVQNVCTKAKPIKENPTKRGGAAPSKIGGGGGRPTCPQGRKQAPNQPHHLPDPFPNLGGAAQERKQVPNQPRHLPDPFPNLGGAAPSWLFLDKLKIDR